MKGIQFNVDLMDERLNDFLILGRALLLLPLLLLLL